MEKMHRVKEKLKFSSDNLKAKEMNL